MRVNAQWAYESEFPEFIPTTSAYRSVAVSSWCWYAYQATRWLHRVVGCGLMERAWARQQPEQHAQEVGQFV
jgi:hypothetical protein